MITKPYLRAHCKRDSVHDRPLSCVVTWASLVGSGGNDQPGVPCTSSFHDDPYLSFWLGSAEDEDDGRLAGR